MRSLSLLLLLALLGVNKLALADRIEVRADSEQVLAQALVTLLEQQLAPRGVIVDRAHVRLSVSGGTPCAAVLQADLAPIDAASEPASPFRFTLYAATNDADARHGTLAVTLLREVAVAKRRLRKGSAIECSDIGSELRELRRSRAALTHVPCKSEFVALRDLTAGDILRSGDIGATPDVAAGAAVRVGVRSGAVQVTILATALADAAVGQVMDVRLERPARTLRARVIRRGEAQLEGAP